MCFSTISKNNLQLQIYIKNHLDQARSQKNFFLNPETPPPSPVYAPDLDAYNIFYILLQIYFTLHSFEIDQKYLTKYNHNLNAILY